MKDLIFHFFIMSSCNKGIIHIPKVTDPILIEFKTTNDKYGRMK